MAAPSYYNDHNRNGLLKFKIELTSNGKRLTANCGLRYIPKTSVLNRASDRVRQKMGNSAAFSREIMRRERSIMRQIMRFF